MANLMTDPDQMRAMANRFHAHADNVLQHSQAMMASAENISGAGWSGGANNASHGTVTDLHQAFTNIHNVLHNVRDNLVSSASTYETQEQHAAHTLST
ncbi:MAG: WXG100 family type VII secretion target [Mycobacteriaceae bacterium]|nr:WXG100 family type VII secretion target [Mycobacteriaceae bacterium]MBV9638444.1 WXG100 family type VII secretion target [Mycobacteriaceae bacterium]